MKKYIFTLLLGALIFGLSGCSGLLETNPSSSVSDSDVFKTVNGAKSALNGCYFQMESGDGGANRQDDWGYPTHQMTYDVCGEDMIVWGGWYGYDYNFWGHTRGDIFKSSCLWIFYYRLINNLNSVIAYTPDAEGDVNERDHVLGQAYAMRGWAYFQLIRLYQHTYIIAQNMPGVPIYLEPTTDQTEGKPRGTVQQVYDQILLDLLEGERLLAGYNRGTRKNRINQKVCQGFLAEVYLTMNKWSDAATYSAKARSGMNLTTNAQYLAGFNDYSTPSWMWGIAPTKDQNMGDYSPFAMWANWSRKGYTFQCFFLADKFVELFDQNDIRFSQVGWVWSQIHTSDKFRDNDELIGNIVFMRTEEMLLIEAEALARQGQESGAKTLLWTLQDLRGANRSQSSGSNLIEDILIERRKELYGEGFAWFDMIRNQKPLVRAGNHINYGGYTPLPARSWRFVYQIPNAEIINNVSLESGFWPNGDQTPFDGIYQP